MKRAILLVWYFALNSQIYSFEKKEHCETLHSYMKGQGLKVMEKCQEVNFRPDSNAAFEQRTSGANSPAIVGGKGGVTINNGKVKK